jgi:hypothetical protein
LTEDVSLFDAAFFNLSAETAAVGKFQILARPALQDMIMNLQECTAYQSLDPQFRLQLETTYEALESGTQAILFFCCTRENRGLRVPAWIRMALTDC